jgi:hypothetical protein
MLSAREKWLDIADGSNAREARAQMTDDFVVTTA